MLANGTECQETHFVFKLASTDYSRVYVLKLRVRVFVILARGQQRLGYLRDLE